jgi:hypothetical protein
VIGEPRDAGRGRFSPLGGAGWVLTLALVVFGVVGFVQIRELLSSQRRSRVGDGRNVASYGFDLSTCVVDRSVLVASGMPKDTLEPLEMPRLMTPAAVDSLNRAERGKYLVDGDLVIGVVVGDCARAYPLRVLSWHEVANDTLGGRPIAVTWHPLCGSAVVFDRSVAGATLRFGQSGLLWNSNLLIYDDRAEPTAESLWSQLQARAVAGPGAARGDSLAVLPHVLAHWDRWRDSFPETTVPFPEQNRRRSYQRDPYAHYEGSDLLRFPVEPLPPGDERPYKTPIVAIRGGDGWQVSVVGDNARRWSGSLTEPTVHAYWFAWFATRGGERAGDPLADSAALR